MGIAITEDGVVDRLEIPKKIKLEVYKRAGGPDHLVCEGCKLPIMGKRFDYDHIRPEVFNEPKSARVITADDVQLLGYECCHKFKSAREHKDNCHGKRIVAKAAKATKKSTWRKKPDGMRFDWSKGRYVKEVE